LPKKNVEKFSWGALEPLKNHEKQLIATKNDMMYVHEVGKKSRAGLIQGFHK
jgi:hypothetical protein